MTKILPLALHAACAAALALMATGASAQTAPPGRTAFDQNGCRSCHAYASRRGAPSVRDMLVSLEGEPETALKGIEQSEEHVSRQINSAVSESDRRSIAEWIASATFEEPEPVPPPPAAITPAPVVTVPAPAIAITAPAPALPAVTPRRSTGNLTGLVIEPGKKADRLVITLSGRNPDDLDIQSIDGKLVIRLPGISRGASVPATITAAKTSRSVDSVQSIDQDGTLTVTVAPRTGELKYSATQGRNRLLIELTAVPSKKKNAKPTAIAAIPVVAPAIIAIPSVGAGLPGDKTKASGKQVTEKAAAAKPVAIAKSASTPTDEAKPKQASKAQADAEAKKETESQALAKKEAAAKITQAATKKEAEDKAQREISATTKAETDMLAALRASAEAIQGGGAETASTTKRRKDRSKMKAPDKFRDDPCPPIGETEPIGTVDVARAKDIIDRVGCPQCHAFVQKKTGPPFKRVFAKVKGNPSCVVQRLKKNKEHNDEGVTDDLQGAEFKIVADYLATRAK